jgi:thiosulfate/3-mercaptopyruvate sulfurtransferase
MASNAISEPMVSVKWLNKHLNSENLIILDSSIKKVVGGTEDITEIQIPNTRFFDLKEAFSDVSAPFPTTFPSEEQFTKSAQALGINSSSAMLFTMIKESIRVLELGGYLKRWDTKM